jgi:hypothetical protein
MKSLLLSAFFLLAVMHSVKAQDIKVSAGPEILRSFNFTEVFYGWGGSAQATWWVRSTLGLGINSGYYHFQSNTALIGANKFPTYSMIPVFFVVRYPIPVFEGLYGQDMFGYSFTQDVQLLKADKAVTGGFTYYFALGYVIHNHFDLSLKVGRTRLNKKNDTVNVNEHNVGLKLAYIF